MALLYIYFLLKVANMIADCQLNATREFKMGIKGIVLGSYNNHKTIVLQDK